MNWAVLGTVISALALVILLMRQRRIHLDRMAQAKSEIQNARKKGSHRARLQYPHIDASRCLGCGSCMRACPEEGVIMLINGQAKVVHGARCVGHGLCSTVCPVNAIAVTLGDIKDRNDIPTLTDKYEVKNIPGFYLAGEVTGHALIRTAFSHGCLIAEEVANRFGGKERDPDDGTSYEKDDLLDLCIVGAGPAGMACSLGAKSRGLKFLTLDQEGLGGTVAKYPRRKLVMTQPATLPLVGKLKRKTYLKEELMDLWEDIAEKHELPIKSGEEFTGLERYSDSTFVVKTRNREYRARSVCLALGRRGSPRKLGVPGEELPKVVYSLLDAHSYRDRRILVVGGGDSAIEAAIGLAAQPGNCVTLSYRKEAFFRIKAKNETLLMEALEQGRLDVVFRSRVSSITEDKVYLVKETQGGENQEIHLDNDDVFVFAGGTPPFKLLEDSGVSFDPADRPFPATLMERGTGLKKALYVTLLFIAVIVFWGFLFADYYGLVAEERPLSPRHEWLKPSGTLGIGLGVVSTVLIFLNLSYLLRRSRLGGWIPGSMKAWMVSHVITGILACLVVFVHGALAPRNTVGGHAFLGLFFLVVTGGIGRYFYSFIPRALNGRELVLDEVKNLSAILYSEWERHGLKFGEKIGRIFRSLTDSGQWRKSFFRRLGGLLQYQTRLSSALKDIRKEGLKEGLAEEQILWIINMVRKAHRTSLMVSHYEDLHSLLASWRYFHRWIALLMVLLVSLHILTAIRYGGFFR